MNTSFDNENRARSLRDELESRNVTIPELVSLLGITIPSAVERELCASALITLNEQRQTFAGTWGYDENIPLDELVEKVESVTRRLGLKVFYSPNGTLEFSIMERVRIDFAEKLGYDTDMGWEQLAEKYKDELETAKAPSINYPLHDPFVIDARSTTLGLERCVHGEGIGTQLAVYQFKRFVTSLKDLPAQKRRSELHVVRDTIIRLLNATKPEENESYNHPKLMLSIFLQEQLQKYLLISPIVRDAARKAFPIYCCCPCVDLAEIQKFEAVFKISPRDSMQFDTISLDPYLNALKSLCGIGQPQKWRAFLECYVNYLKPNPVF